MARAKQTPVFLFFLLTPVLACKNGEPSQPAPPEAETSADSPPVGAPRDDEIPTRDTWYDFAFKGQKVGYFHTAVEPVERAGGVAIHTVQSSVLEVKRLDQEVRMESSVQAWARPDGSPLEFVHRRQEGGQVRKIRGRRVEEGFEVVITVGDQQTRTVHPMDSDLLLASTLEALWFDELNPDFRRQGRAISESEGDVQPFTVEVERKEEGRFVVRQKMGGIVSRAWVRPDGVTEKMTIPAMGATFERTTRARAVKLGEKVDLFSAGLFSVPRPLPPRDDIASLRVRVRTRSEAPPPVLEDLRQQVTSAGEAPILTLTRTPEPPGQTQIPVTREELSPYLEETPFEDLDDPELVQTARKVVGDADRVWAAAQRINRFVNERIRNKTLARAFNSASEALEAREGDCTEHAVLFSALAKITGIPVRLATGLIYVGGVRNQFGYHEWVEVWTDGAWYPMDPTFRQDRADPTHIKFAVGQSDPEGLRASGAVAASLIGDLELEVLSVKTRDGRVMEFE